MKSLYLVNIVLCAMLTLMAFGPAAGFVASGGLGWASAFCGWMVAWSTADE